MEQLSQLETDSHTGIHVQKEQHIRSSLENESEKDTAKHARFPYFYARRGSDIHLEYQRSLAEDSPVLDNLKIELARVLRWEHEIMRAKWIQEGDHNTSFFHALVKERWKQSTIKIRQQDGYMETDPHLIGIRAANFSGTYSLLRHITLMRSCFRIIREL